MFKKIFTILIIFIIGGAGGILVPYATSYFLKLDKDRPVIINKTEQVTISRQVASAKAYQKNIASLVSIISPVGKSTARGLGFIISSDGLVLTRREWVPAGSDFVSIVYNNETIPAETIKRSDDDGFVLLKIKASNLSAVSLSSPEDNELGSDLYLIGFKQGFSGQISFIDAGILKSKDGSILETNIIEDSKLATGAPVFNLNGDVAGIAAVNSSGYVFAISSDAIKKFIR